MIKFGVIGYGYGGPNIVRNFSWHQDCKDVADIKILLATPAAVIKGNGAC